MKSIVSAILTLVCLCVITFSGTSVRAVGEQAAACLAATTNGDVQGARRDGTCAYIGIPYAAPPTGNLRWRPPQPRAPWAPATLDVTNALRQCAQLNVNTGAVMGMEDCLWLNVWAPAATRSGRGRPVLVWLHTGAFQAATANFAASDGARFAELRDAVVVAPNYRLGPFGFLAHSALTAEDPGYPASGNYGIADQRAALRWVKGNIAAFGGDPDNVTLAGTSAGGHSTSIHLVSPASRGLFHNAIMQSGNALSRKDTASEAAGQGAAFATALGCVDSSRVLSCMRTATAEQVLRALPLGQAQILEGNRVDWGPVVDGVEIPDQPREMYRRGQFSRVPIVIGVNGDEGWTYVDRSFPGGIDAVQYERAVRTEFGMDANAVLALYPAAAFASPKDALARLTGDAEYVCEARRIARVMHHDGASVYFYSFEYGLEGVAERRALHGLESNFVFQNDFAITPNVGINAPRALGRADLVVSDAMSMLWRRFMERGDPNLPDAPVVWPTYRPGPSEGLVESALSDRYFVFGDRFGVGNYLRDSPCNFWEAFYFRSLLGTVPAASR